MNGFRIYLVNLLLEVKLLLLQQHNDGAKEAGVIVIHSVAIVKVQGQKGRGEVHPSKNNTPQQGGPISR